MTALPSNNPHRILVVDDSPTMRAVCSEKLTNVGLQCEKVATAEEGWQKLGESLEVNTPYSAVLLDWILPGMSGEDLLRLIKNDGRFKQVAMMIFTERPDQQVWELVLSRPNTDIQLKDELDLLPQRMLKFITSVEEMTASQGIEKIDESTRQKRAKETILLVDDSATVRMRYSSLLRESGYEVVEASGCKEGLEIAQRDNPSLAIIDFYMPDGNGDTLCRQLTASDIIDVTVVMFSQRKEVIEIALEAGAIDLLFKDDSAHLFIMRVNALMHMIQSKRINRQLDLLMWATQAFGFGIMQSTLRGLKSENPIMETFEQSAGGLEVFNTVATYDEPLVVNNINNHTDYFVVQRYPYNSNEEILVAQDITQMKQAEALIQTAKEAADAANQAKSDFLSNMTHELRSPLNSIIVLSKMLSEKKNDNMTQKQFQSIEMINKSGNELLQLINDILDLAKVEAGMLKIDVQKFNLRATINHLVVQMKPIAEGKPLVLSANVSEHIPEIIQTDEMRLSQIIRNLISNAVKFTPKGQVNINVDLLNHNTVQLSVTDTGIGIKPQNLESIFEAFQQEDTSTSRRFGGTGLGLNISRNLLNLLGGKISITSTYGEGSCFTIAFPIDLDITSIDITLPTQNDVAEEIKATSTENTIVKQNNTVKTKDQRQENAEEHNDLRNKKVMLVEDDTRNIFTLMTALEPYDIDFIVAQNGQEALDKLDANKPPDIVLMDIMMPVMDGYEAIKKIRQQTKWSSLPIIAVTANSQNNEEERCRRLGATDFLSKPVDIDNLVTKMSDALQAAIIP